MRILGIGVDIIENQRIKLSIRSNKFVKRIFTKDEFNKSKKIKNVTGYFAKRFAAKEAFIKAVGTGFSKSINFSDIEILNDKSGKPKVYVSEKLKKVIKIKHKVKNYAIDLSLSDEKKYSIAFVVLTKSK